MARRLVCTDHDKALWKWCRKHYLTASDLFTWSGAGGPYWPGKKQDILDDKLRGVERDFKPASYRKMEHGSYDEDHNRTKFCHYAKLRSRPAHYMIGNDRWPYLAATLDGIIAPPKQAVDINPLIFTDPEHVQGVRDRMLFEKTVGIAELKQTDENAKTRNAWFGYERKGVWTPSWGPEYYHPQVQAQMHIGEFSWCVLVGQIGASNMHAHFFERDPAFAEQLDEWNEEFRAEVGFAGGLLLAGGAA